MYIGAVAADINNNVSGSSEANGCAVSTVSVQTAVMKFEILPYTQKQLPQMPMIRISPRPQRFVYGGSAVSPRTQKSYADLRPQADASAVRTPLMSTSMSS